MAKTKTKSKSFVKKSHRERVREELEQLRQHNGGDFVAPAAVVEFARRNKRAALHKEFEWDDTKAAQRFRLDQARHLIRLYINVIETEDGDIPARMYVSLEGDRKSTGGYRTLESVMTNAELREQLLQQALDEFQRVRRKYQTLQELAPIFAAMDRVVQRTTVARAPVGA
jgi:hypothetical protein